MGPTRPPHAWHPHHIAERYSLFTIIVLGESALASTNAIVDAAGHSDDLVPLLVIAACGLLLAAGMWRIYFSRDYHDRLDNLRQALTSGYDTHATGLDGAVSASALTVPIASPCSC